MNKFKSWFYNFMNGRYGVDELGQSISVWTIVIIVASIVLSILGSLFYNLLGVQAVGTVLAVLARLTNWVAIALIVVMAFRMLSRNHAKRRAENARYLSRKAKAGRSSAGKGRGGFLSRFGKGKGAARNDADYLYLDCPFCGQKMRVPRGKGKIAVKCPSCGEKTISNS